MDDLTGEIVDRYRLLEIIGQGGMSTVYKAVDERDDSLVAVKLLSSYVAQEPRFKARFAREVEVLKSLNGGKIVPILDYGEQEAFTYIVMPYLPQGTLQDRLDNGGITLQESASILQDVCAALQLAHDQGIVHRDVKPSNILLDEGNSAYLSDFGFAYVSQASHSLTGSVLIGTPAFMSPEQCRGETVDERSDQYSLGTVLFQLTTGRLPYAADTPIGMVVKHIHDPLPRPRLFNPYLPDAIESVILRAMAKQPEDRFASVRALNRAYQRALRRTLDPETGLPNPEAVGPAPITEALPTAAAHVQSAQTPLWAKGRTTLALVVLAMFAIPLTAWALTGSSPGSDPDVGIPTPTLSADLLATIQVLSTENAAVLGAAVGPDQLQTAVAATVAALGQQPPGQGVTTEATASAVPSATPTPSPTALLISARTGGAGSGDPSGDGGSQPAPTNTPLPPTPVPTSPPTDPPPPPTSPPPADTPRPPPPEPKECKGPDHPVFPCTATP